jgi:uridine kinase
VVEPAAFESVSTWRQPIPTHQSTTRAALVDTVAAELCAIRPARVRVAIDGYTASGKTSFGHELAAAVRARGRSTLRASLDDFKKPWRDAIEQGYDRTSGEGYYRNAPDFASARTLLLEPAGPLGSGVVVLCAHDPLTGEDHRAVTVDAPDDSVLIVDSVFAMRPEYADHWDLTIWLEVSPAVSLERGVGRDTAMEGHDEALALHTDRYHAAEELYIAEVDPRRRADIVIDNTDFASPVRLR